MWSLKINLLSIITPRCFTFVANLIDPAEQLTFNRGVDEFNLIELIIICNLEVLSVSLFKFSQL